MSVITGDNNLRQFPARVEAKVGIAIDWAHLRNLMKQYLDERGGSDDAVLRQLALSDFLFWAYDQQRQRRKVNRESS